MHVALTGATGFLGGYIARSLLQAGHTLKVLVRMIDERAERLRDMGAGLTEGNLASPDSLNALVTGADAVVHAGVAQPRRASGQSPLPTTLSDRRGQERFDFAVNLHGSLELLEAARTAGTHQFVFISSGAVYGEILPDRPLDETHPTWPDSTYGALKVAVEAYLSAYARGYGMHTVSLRPVAIYGLTEPGENSRWFSLVDRVRRSEAVEVTGGRKVVHAAGVAECVTAVLERADLHGQTMNLVDRYVSDFDVACLAQELAGSHGQITGSPSQPQHVIDTSRAEGLGLPLHRGDAALRQYIADLLALQTGGET